MFISIALLFFVVMGSVCAAEVSDVSSTEDSNLTNDNVNSLSQEKLEVSSEDSISQTNMVNSHDDNFENCPEDDALNSSDESYYEDNGEQKLGLAIDVDENLTVSNEDVLNAHADEPILSAKVSTTLSISDTHYGGDNTVFRVSLHDSKGKALTSQKISLKVNGKTYNGVTKSNGVAYIKVANLAIGTYTVSLSYSGKSNYSASSLSKKVKVLTSVSGKDKTRYYSDSNYFSATFWKDAAYLKNTKVTFTISGKKYTFTTDSKGVAKVNISLKPGKYVITTTNPVTKQKITNNLVVKKDTTKIKGKSKVYILPNYCYTYTVELTSSHGAPVENAKVSFSYANTTVNAKTDSKGKASIVIPVLDKGTYNITYRFGGNDYYYSSSSKGEFCIKDAVNKLSASNLKMAYKDGSKFSVKLTDNNGKALANKTIDFVLNNVKYSSKTNSKGVASLAIGDLKPGTYSIRYSYLKSGSYSYNYGYKDVVISKNSLKFNAWNLEMNYKDGSNYKAYVKDNSGKALKNIVVKFKINGTTYSQKTDSSGIARLPITLPVGYYTVESTISNACYTANAITKHILVNGTKFIGSDMYVATGSKTYYSVKLVDGKEKPVKSATVKFTIDGKTYTKKTNSEGIAKVDLGVLGVGTHKIKYVHDSISKSSKIHVLDKVTLSQIISASKTVKKYIESNEKLPTSVKIGSLTFSTPEYLYLASKAIINLKSNNKANIAFMDVKNPSSPGAAVDKGDLSDYLTVAKRLVKTTESKGQMPNSVNSSLGYIGYKGLVYAFSRVVAYYDANHKMPAHVNIKSLSSASSASGLNSVNTISNLAAYLAASTNCQVNNTNIKQLVAKLTDGLTSDTAKAKAIFNYVRDAISYSFYYDTKYGAVGTLNAKKGNCVDHSHLLVAMFRTAGLPARYVHGTCTFSGGTYGHVWTQVLIGNTWVVADATSARNSFGKVVNWNANSYSLKGYYPSIGF